MSDAFVYSLSKSFTFEASHQLKRLAGVTLPDGREHPCSRLHGHSYVVELGLRGTSLDEYGFLIDYHELDVLKAHIDSRFDHHDLNASLSIDNPTAEIIARRILRFCRVVWPQFDLTVTVRETAKTSATVAYRTDDQPLAVDLVYAIGKVFEVFAGANPTDVSACAWAAFTDINGDGE